MKKRFIVSGMLLFFFTMSQPVSAGDARYDSASKILTVPNVKIDDGQTMYNIKLQLQTDGSLSPISQEIVDSESDNETGNGNSLYRSNPLLLDYKLKSEIYAGQSENFPVPPELSNETIYRQSEKWTEETVVGTWKDSFGSLYVFHNGGAGEFTCTTPAVLEPACAEVIPINWDIDSYGNLVFGAVLSDETSLKYTLAMIRSNGDNSISVYYRRLKLKEDAYFQNARSQASGGGIYTLNEDIIELYRQQQP